VAERPGKLIRYQTVTVGLLIAGYSGYYLCRSNLSVTMPLVIAELARRGVDVHAAQVAMGSLASLGVLAYALGKFPSGTIADRFGGRRNFLSGMAGSVAFTVLFSLAGSVPFFTLAWIGNRAVQSLGWAGAVKITSRWFSFHRYGTVMALISLSYLFGDAVSREFMALLIAQGLGWRGVFAVAAAVLGGLWLICFLWLRESPGEIGEEEPKENPTNLFAEPRAALDHGVWRVLFQFSRNSTFWMACALSLGTTIVRETFNLWTPTYFTQAAGMTAAQAASSSALFPLVAGLSVLLCGWLSDGLGRGGRAAVLTGGLLLGALVLLLLGSGVTRESRTLPVTFVTLVAFLIGGPYSLLAGAISLDFGGKQASATASGIIDGVGYLGGVLSGDSIARISVSYGWNGAFLFLSAAAFLSAVAGFRFFLHERIMRKIAV